MAFLYCYRVNVPGIQKTLIRARISSENNRIKITGIICRSGAAAADLAGVLIPAAGMYGEKEKRARRKAQARYIDILKCWGIK
jgi:hypothetical protein